MHHCCISVPPSHQCKEIQLEPNSSCKSNLKCKLFHLPSQTGSLVFLGFPMSALKLIVILLAAWSSLEYWRLSNWHPSIPLMLIKKSASTCHWSVRLVSLLTAGLYSVRLYYCRQVMMVYYIDWDNIQIQNIYDTLNSERHPILHPHLWVTQYLLWVYCRKLTLS